MDILARCYENCKIDLRLHVEEMNDFFYYQSLCVIIENNRKSHFN